jgi:hypothetical protein
MIYTNLIHRKTTPKKTQGRHRPGRQGRRQKKVAAQCANNAFMNL